MTRSAIAAIAALIIAPQATLASDAFLTQVSAGPVTVTLPAQPDAPSIGTVTGALSPGDLISDVAMDLPDLSDTPLPSLTGAGALANIGSVGNGNGATIVQSGLNAALIMQNGNANAASVYQAGQANRAAIYQNAIGATAIAMQTGAGNSALIVQR